MTTFSRALPTILTTVLTTAALSAQSLDGQVVSDPQDTVTYTIDLDGPPRGSSFVLISPLLWNNPIQIPGFFHPLWLDPLALFVTPAIPLDQQGQGALSFTVPTQAIPDQPFYFQSLSLDLSNNLAFSVNALMLVQNFAAPAAPAPQQDPESYAMGWKTGSDAGTTIWGTPGQNYRVVIKDPSGNVAAERVVTVGANGNTGYQSFPLAELSSGYTYEIWRDEGGGGMTSRWSGTF